MGSQQMSLFEELYERKEITKPIRLIELFAGIGAQAKALEILGVPFEHHKTCEWAYNSIIGYNAIHIKDNTDYAKDMTKEQLLDYLQGNISINYNEPADLKKKSLEWLKTCYNSCIANHNLMNIMNVKGKDLEITDTDKYEYILTYSFPCQDLSIAGNRKGMSVSQADGGTRSGLLWEVERILFELSTMRERESNCLPQILIMENVPDVIGSNNIKDFQKWRRSLEKLGYSNYCEVLNSKDYGIPQNRNRCFMISILGESFYEFPRTQELKYRLKNFLETIVDEKYYLDVRFTSRYSKFDTINCIAEKYNKEVDGCHQIANLNYYNHEQSDRVYGTDGLSPTIRVRYDEANAIKIQVNKKYIGVYDIKESDTFRPTQDSRIHINSEVGKTICTNDRSFCVIEKNNKEEIDVRKITPLEALKLMGFEYKDYQTLVDAGLSDSAIYHCAGDSIVTCVISYIVNSMLKDSREDRINKYIETLTTSK